ncbi:hypothetical protein ACVR0S_09500 [Streptococcus dentapri]|uniref:Immunity protein 63 domain-containing protein n=1 Tax=Streptococcus dentapri TaxID=573564 RepID=A0ABV8D3L7_9STRE
MLAELQNKIENEVFKIENINLSNLGIYFLSQPPYFPEGINVVENKNGNYNLIFTERGKVTSEVIGLTADEVDYRLLKVVVQTISSEKIEGTNEFEIKELINNHAFDKIDQLVKKMKEKRYQYEKELLGKINPKYSIWYENEH